MNYKEAAKLIGKQGRYDHGKMFFTVEILDLREVFGRTDVEVRPVSGSGTAWVSLDKIKVIS